LRERSELHILEHKRGQSRMVASRAAVLLLAVCCCTFCAAIDMKWTPNGEGPAPFSTKARQQMGMDPGAFAGQEQQAPAAGKSGMLGFSMGMVLSIYFANNWKIVLALQDVLRGLIAPFAGAAAARKAAATAASERLRLQTEKAARLERLKAKMK